LRGSRVTDVLVDVFFRVVFGETMAKSVVVVTFVRRVVVVVNGITLPVVDTISEDGAVVVVDGSGVFFSTVGNSNFVHIIRVGAILWQ